MEEEPATASEAIQSSELLDDISDGADDDLAAPSETELAAQQPQPPSEPIPERPPADGDPEFLRLEDDGGGAAVQDQPEPVDVDPGSAELASSDAEAPSAAPSA